MGRKIGIIALDLDGTLLNSSGEISPRTHDALLRCADAGIEIVPTTGRFFGAMPQFIRELPFLHYAITINGAAVFDIRRGETVCSEAIALPDAIALMQYLDTLPVCYDCYVNNAAYMTADLRSRIAEFTDSPKYIKMVLALRQPVDELKAYLSAQSEPVQKVMLFTRHPEVRKEILEHLSERFPMLVASSSTPDNVEINQVNANKGRALYLLADYLGIPRTDTMSFGDGLNDLSMILAAGIGVAMANSEAAVLEAADYVTGDCDSDGIADAIDHIIFGGN